MKREFSMCMTTQRPIRVRHLSCLQYRFGPAGVGRNCEELNLAYDFTNTTFWMLVVVFGILACTWAWYRRTPSEFGRVASAIRRLLSSRVALAFLVISNSAIAGLAIYLSYAAPLNIMQDIVSAREFMQGKPLYPPNMGDLMREALQKEPAGLDLGKWSPGLKEKEAREQIPAGTPFVQAHPPLMTLFFAPFSAWMGVRAICLAFAGLSLLALLLTELLLFRGLDLNLSSREQAALAFAILGWYPVLCTLRWGQSGNLLTALTIMGWYYLRSNRPILSGMSIGLATCLKVFPGLLLVYLFFRHRRAFVAAALTILGLTGIAAIVVGWQSYGDYSAAAHFVTMRFGGSRFNLSLLGIVSRLLGGNLGFGFYQTTPTAFAIYVGIAVSVVGALVLLLLRKPSPAGVESVDFEYSLFVALMPLLSPLSWDHYMVVLLLPILFLIRQIAKDKSEAVLGLAGLLMVLAIPAWSFHINTRVAPVSIAMLVLWCWIAMLYWRRKRDVVAEEADKTLARVL